MKKERTIIILGMHRSATSAAAAGFQEIGVNMGTNHSIKNGDLTKGKHFENSQFLQLNREILQNAGGNWKQPPSHEKIMQYPYKNKIKKLIEKNRDKDWGFKDPRTTLTIDLYTPYLNNVFYIACFRNPKNVAKSLNKRSGMPLKKGIALAKEYNKRLSKFMQKITQIN